MNGDAQLLAVVNQGAEAGDHVRPVQPDDVEQVIDDRGWVVAVDDPEQILDRRVRRVGNEKDARPSPGGKAPPRLHDQAHVVQLHGNPNDTSPTRAGGDS